MIYQAPSIIYIEGLEQVELSKIVDSKTVPAIHLVVRRGGFLTEK